MDGKDKTGKKVIVAMSGGVDSSVSALLLKNSGFEAVGVYMKFLAETSDNIACLPKNRCPLKEPEQKARKTSIRLGIPFCVLDLRQEFKKLVVDKFVADSKKGLTPNPCTICNQEIKFSLFIDEALGMGANYVATGHYAQVKKTKDGIFKLYKGRDKNKDQSYFLWRLGQKQLSRTLFPLGIYTKDEVAKIAKKFKLPTAKTAESQEICFAPRGAQVFLRKHLKEKKGKIVDQKGQVLGYHCGLWFYTIGQRKGIRLSGGPFYVLAKNVKRNELIVTKNKKDLKKSQAVLVNVNWISGSPPKLPLRIKAKIRYKSAEFEAYIRRRNNRYLLLFSKPQTAVTPGQSAVFYRRQELVGGAVIQS